MDVVDAATLADVATSAAATEALAPGHGGGALVVDLRDVAPAMSGRCRAALEGLRGLPVVLVALARTERPAGLAGLADVVVGDEAGAAEVVGGVDAHPQAATALAVHLRASEGLAVEQALAAESAVYATLQAGPEHHRWLAGRTPTALADLGDERVRMVRRGDRLTITLARSGVRNAVDAAMQQALVEALLVAAGDDVAQVDLRAEGPVFSSGGDLREFGSLADPASAHLLRLARSPARALHRVAGRTTAHVQGACHGAGVELPAFAARVVAAPGTTFTLPEVAMGLVPGAGGTVSIPRRVGRQRAAWLAVTGRTLDTATALAWGLVDDVAS